MRLGYAVNSHGADAVAQAVKDALAGRPALLVLADCPRPDLGRNPRAYRVEVLALEGDQFRQLSDRHGLKLTPRGTSPDAGLVILPAYHQPLDPTLAAARTYERLTIYAMRARDEFDVRLPGIFRPLDELVLDPTLAVHLAFDLNDELTG